MPDSPTIRELSIAHYQKHPEDYVRNILGVQPDELQIRALQAIAQPNARVALPWANGRGKDAMCSWLPEWFLYNFASKDAPAKVPTTSASGRQNQLFWNELHYWHAKSAHQSAFELLTHELRFSKKMLDKNPKLDSCIAHGFKAGNEKTVEGNHAPKMLFILTEARGAEDFVFRAMLKASTGADNRIVVQSVPGDEAGEFYAICQRLGGRDWDVIWGPSAKRVFECEQCKFEMDKEGLCPTCKQETTKKYKSIAKHVSQRSIDEKLAYGEDSSWFVAPVLAQFAKTSADSIISLSQFNRAVEITWEECGDSDEWVLGVDASWIGNNETIFAERCGRRLMGLIPMQFEAISDNATKQQADYITQWLQFHPEGLAVIEHGVAQAGIIDRVHENRLGDRLITIPTGSPAYEPDKFFNRRSEIYYYLSLRFGENRIAINPTLRNDPLVGQLTAMKRKLQGDLIWRLEDKHEMMRRISRQATEHGSTSPDRADAVALAFSIGGDSLIRKEDLGISLGGSSRVDFGELI